MTKTTKVIIFIFCAAKLALHLLADSHSGFQGDELLHIEAGKHLSFGYMEFPPLIGWLAFIQNLFRSDSVFVYHIFPHVASLLILLFIAKITLELGGGNKAVFFALMGMLIAPACGRSQQLFQPVVFSQLFWVLGFYQLVKYVKYLDKRSLWLLTLFCILGMSTKYDALFFIFGLTSLLLFKRTRESLIENKFWINLLVFVLCLLPNFLWQMNHDFPALQMFSRLYETQLDQLSRTKIIKDLLMGINPIVSLLLFFTGLYYLITSRERTTIRPLAVAIGLSFALLLFKNGKAYYFFPLAFTVFPFGALQLETMTTKSKWILYPVLILLLLGCAIIPFGMPVYNLKSYLLKIYPYEKKEIEGGKFGVNYDEYYTNEKWEATLLELKTVYDSLPAREKNNCLIWGKHYGQAGAVNVLGEQYKLPSSFSYHGSFYMWAPAGKMPTTIIALSYRVGDFFQPYFEVVKKVRTIYNPYANTEEELYQYIYICQKPKQDFDKMKSLFKSRVFE